MMEQSGDHDKMIATDNWISIYLDELKKGKKIKINPFGFSMYPLLVGNRDSLVLDEISRPLKRGDICLYRRDDGKYVTHTVHHKDNLGTYFLGESQVVVEGPLRDDQILAVAESFIRNGHEYSCDNVVYKFFHEIWIMLRPVRKPLIKIYRFVRRV